MKRVLLLSLGLLLLCFPLVGCDSEETLAAEEIAEIVEGVGTSDMETCTFDMDISATVGIDANGESMTASIVGGGEGAIDVVNEEMHMPLSIEATAPFIGSQEISMEMYIVDGWMYMNMDGQWTKEEVPLEMLGEQDQSIMVGQLVDLLTIADIAHKGSDTINGVDCYEFHISPDMAELAEYAMEQFPQSEIGDAELDVLEDMEDILSAFSVECTFWISKEEGNNRLMKIEMDLGGNLSSADIPEMGEIGFNSVSLDMTMEIVFDYNVPVNIVLPDEALNAYYQGDYEW